MRCASLRRWNLGLRLMGLPCRLVHKTGMLSGAGPGDLVGADSWPDAV